ncbi:hypothetical protein LCGC14_2922720 [marine sediment metagenome]|uniref:Uncharacterized protein n=1 Tax=marine sediment metagenome TaxID=412755 RepID=A0A0F9AEB8_9ZZZZ
MFNATYKGKHGTTVEHDDPKRQAYKYMALAQGQGRHTSTTWHADGCITVSVDGLEALTFEPYDRSKHVLPTLT